MRKLAAFILSFCLPLMVLAQSAETDQQRRMAAQMAEYMDMACDGQFQFKAAAFDPNGRYVLEEMEGFTWSRQDVTVTAGEAALITIEIS